MNKNLATLFVQLESFIWKTLGRQPLAFSLSSRLSYTPELRYITKPLPIEQKSNSSNPSLDAFKSYKSSTGASLLNSITEKLPVATENEKSQIKRKVQN